MGFAVARRSVARSSDLTPAYPAAYHVVMAKLTDEQRFLSKVEFIPTTSCWLWLGHVLKSSGYGQVRHDGKPQLAHRVSYQLFKGPIPEGQVCRHSCDWPVCVAPHHITLGSLSDNTADMLERGRHVGKTGGEKLDHGKARAIREMHADGVTRTEIAAFFGVARQTVYAVLKGQTWRD